MRAMTLPRSIVAAIGASVMLAATAASAHAAIPGDFDPSFGVGGKSHAGFDGSTAYAQALAVQPDGRIVVAGTSNRSDGVGSFAVARLLPTGSFDESFGVKGRSQASIDGNDDAEAVAIQPDGKIVVAGATKSGHMGVTRLLPNGYYDRSFGEEGRSRAGIPGTHATANAVAIQPDGKIVLAGTITADNPAAKAKVFVVRLLPNGYYDPTFGVDGKAQAGFPDSDDNARSIAIQSDGKIIVAGTTARGNDEAMLVVRLMPNGYYDTSFGVDGKSRVFSDNSEAYAVALQPDGKIVVAGTAATFPGLHMAISRLLPNGYYDTSFGVDGKSEAGFAGHTEIANALAIQPDGKIVVAGDTTWGSGEFLNSNMAVVRLLSNGLYDSSFGNDGKSEAGFKGNSAARAVALQQDGKILIAGGDDSRAMAVARLLR